MYRHPWRRTLCENGRCSVLICRISRLRRADHYGLHRLCFRWGRHHLKFPHVKFLNNSHSKQLPLSWSPLLLAQLLIVLKEFLNLHPYVRFPTLPHKVFCLCPLQNWDPPHSTLGSSIKSLSSHVEGFLFSFVELVTLVNNSGCELRIRSLWTPASQLRNQFATCVEPIRLHTLCCRH